MNQLLGVISTTLGSPAELLWLLRARHPQNGVIGVSVARHEQSEDPPMTRLELGAFVPRNRLAREPLQVASKMRRPKLTRLGFWAGAPTTGARGGNVEIFVVLNELLKTNSNRFKMSDHNVVVHKESTWL